MIYQESICRVWMRTTHGAEVCTRGLRKREDPHCLWDDSREILVPMRNNVLKNLVRGAGCEQVVQSRVCRASKEYVGMLFDLLICLKPQLAFRKIGSNMVFKSETEILEELIC